MSPSISVLMPVYNCAQYLDEAIQSILNQTYSNFELIVLDDGSTDGSADIVKTYSDKRIRYHCNEKNLGLANNLNVGLALANGEYIARMDGDDISFPERFQKQIDFLESHPEIDLCSCGLQMFGTENTVWIRESDPEAVKITMMFYSPVLHATSVWRKASFEKHKLLYDQNAFPAEDYDLWSRAIFHCNLANIPQVLYKYRIHGIQVTKTDDRVSQKDREIRIRYLENALPNMDKNFYASFVDNFITAANLKVDNTALIKRLYLQLLQANSKHAFFNQKLLQHRLSKYYQSYLVRMLQAKPDKLTQLKIVSKMNCRTFTKWLLK